MRLVILESPYAAPTPEGTAANVAYAHRCLRDSLARGEAPAASHILFAASGVLDDRDPEQRARGLAAGLAWLRAVEASVVYTDRGVSRGMAQGIERAVAWGVPVEYRTIGEAE